MLKEEIREGEIRAFLFSLSDNKAPGTSRLTPAYYKQMWPYLGKLITNAVNQCLAKGEIPKKQREGAIVLIPKSGKTQNISQI